MLAKGLVHIPFISFKQRLGEYKSDTWAARMIYNKLMLTAKYDTKYISDHNNFIPDILKNE